MTDYPSLPEQGKNLAKFALDVIKNAMGSNTLFVSDEIREQRLETCRGCEWYDEKQVRCKHCGCFLNEKTKFSLDSCPIGKWKESDRDWMNGGFEKFLDEIKQKESNQSDANHPVFPTHPELDDVYEWRDMSWKWNGAIWMIM